MRSPVPRVPRAADGTADPGRRGAFYPAGLPRRAELACACGRFPVTADFMYLRLHGAERMYSGSCDDPALDDWADRITACAAGDEPAGAERITRDDPATAGARDVYAYFDSDEKTKAPFDARRLMERLGLAADRPEPGSEEAVPGWRLRGPGTGAAAGAVMPPAGGRPRTGPRPRPWTT